MWAGAARVPWGDVRQAEGDRMTNGELVRARKDCRLCVEGGPSRLLNGSSFDSVPEVVSHWSQWLGHQRPRLLVVGQDFSGADYFERNLAATTAPAARGLN